MRSHSYPDHERVPVPNRRVAVLLAILLGFGGGVAVRSLAAYYGYTAPAWNFTLPRTNTEGSEAEGTSTAVAAPGLTQFQLVQKLVDAIAGRSDGETIYESIPRQQLDGLSYEEFQQYIDVLAGILANQPTSFVPVALSERDQQITSMIQHGEAWRELAEHSLFFWLETARTPDTGERFGIAIQVRADQQPYLARDWVTHAVDVYKYAQIYIQAIHESNAPLLASMIYSGIADDEVRQLKARDILRHQLAYPTPSSMGVRVRQLRPDSLVIERLSIGMASIGTGASSRFEIAATDRGSFVVHDGLPSVVDPELAGLWTPYRYEREFLTEEEETRPTEMEEINEATAPSPAEADGEREPAGQVDAVPTLFAPSEIWRRVEREQAERVLTLGDRVEAAQIYDDTGPLIGAQAIYDRETLALMQTATASLPEMTELFESISPDLTEGSGTTELPYTPDPRYLVLRFDAVSIVLDDFYFRAGDDWGGTVVAFTLLDESVALGDPSGACSFTVASPLREWMLCYPFSDRSMHRLMSRDGDWLVEALVGVDSGRSGSSDPLLPLRLLRVVRAADEKAGVFENLEPIQLYTITDNIEITESETVSESETRPGGD
ncbi:MAG: hypothetical protein QM270_08775 [Bacillota bacterium]|nr:hypothetical protein [Bacillota bacterium]